MDAHDVHARRATRVDALRGMMLTSWETYVSYTMPLGLHHLIGRRPLRPDAVERRRTAATTGPRRTTTAPTRTASASTAPPRGSNAVGQYFPPVRDEFDDVGRCPEKSAAVVPPRALGPQDAVRPDAVGGAVRQVQPRRPRGRAAAIRVAVAGRARSTPTGIAPSPSGSRSRSPTPRSGATSASSTSSNSARCRSIRS